MNIQSGRIEAAVRTIVNECASSSRPLDCLGKHLELLREDPTWEFADALRVAVNVLRQMTGER